MSTSALRPLTKLARHALLVMRLSASAHVARISPNYTGQQSVGQLFRIAFRLQRKHPVVEQGSGGYSWGIIDGAALDKPMWSPCSKDKVWAAYAVAIVSRNK